MNNYLKIGIAFVTGTVLGAFGMKKYIEYKQENESYEYYDEDSLEVEMENENVEEDSLEKDERDDNVRDNYNDISEITSTKDDNYMRILNDLKYRHAYDNEVQGEVIITPSSHNGSTPYEITQSEFEAIDSYESDEYTYYADGYVTDSYGMPISKEDKENTIGLNFHKCFDDHKDQIWIRNDRLQMDFSVIRDLDKFEDVAPTRIKRMAGLR